MASENAKQVAKKLSEAIGSGKKVDLGKIIRSAGYSKKTSQTPKRVTETKTFKAEISPVVEAMIRERDRAIKAMAKKINKAKYRDTTDAVDKLTKNIQLLSGKETEKSNITFEWEK